MSVKADILEALARFHREPTDPPDRVHIGAQPFTQLGRHEYGHCMACGNRRNARHVCPRGNHARRLTLDTAYHVSLLPREPIDFAADDEAGV